MVQQIDPPTTTAKAAAPVIPTVAAEQGLAYFGGAIVPMSEATALLTIVLSRTLMTMPTVATISTSHLNWSVFA